MRSGLVRRGAVAAAAVLALSACGSGDDDAGTPDPSPTSSSSPSGSSDAAEGDYPYDTTFSGDDLLAEDVSSVQIPGTTSSITWRFPDDFLDDTETTAIDPDNDRSYIALTADVDTDFASAVADLMARYDDLDDAVVATSDVTVGDQQAVAFSVERVGSRNDLLVVFAVDDTTVVAVNYSSADPDGQIPAEKVEAFNQMVGSVALGSS